MKLDVEQVKPLLGIAHEDREQDALLSFILGNVEETVRNYCNLKALPDGLTYTAYRMAIDLYRNEQLGQTETEKPVASLSEGDTSVGFGGSMYESSFTSSLLKRYEKQLARYRRLIW